MKLKQKKNKNNLRQNKRFVLCRNYWSGTSGKWLFKLRKFFAFLVVLCCSPSSTVILQPCITRVLNWLDASRHCPSCHRHSSVKTPYHLIASSRHSLQYLWPHLVRTGSRKGRWQIRQWKSSSTTEINSYSYPEGKGIREATSSAAIFLQLPISGNYREAKERTLGTRCRSAASLPSCPARPAPVRSSTFVDGASRTSTRSCKPGVKTLILILNVYPVYPITADVQMCKCLY